MADQRTTTSTTSQLLRQFWHNFFLSRLENNLIMKELGVRGKVAGKSGTTVHFYRLENLDAPPSSISEGTDPDAQSAKATDITATLTQYGQLVSVSDLFLDTAIDGTLEEILKALAYKAAKKIDDVILGVALGGSNVIYSGNAAARNSIAANNTAVVKDFRKAVALLEGSGVPTFPDGFFRGVIHPDVKYDIQTDTNWTDIVKYRDTVKYDIKGDVGELFGIKFRMTQQIPILVNSGSANTDVYRSLVIGPEFFGVSDLYDVKTIVKNPSPRSALDLYADIGWKALFAAVILDNAHGVRIESASTLGS